MSPPPPLLSGIVVVEIGERIAVAACGGLLAELGATVIAIEPTSPSARGKWSNRPMSMAGKRSVALDFAEPRDIAMHASLLDTADVVLLSTDDDASDGKLWDRPWSARQIVADLTAFGHGGPNEGLGGTEAVVQARTGIVDTTGRPEAAPVAVGIPVLEMTSAVYAAAAVLLALRVRRMRGWGQRIDIALADVAINSLANFLALRFGGRRATRSGNRHPLYAPWNSYRARDGYLLACAVSDDQFARLADAIGAPGLACDPRYRTSSDRFRHFDQLDALIEAWSAQRSVMDCEAALVQAGIPSGRIVPIGDLVDEPNLVHRGSIARARDETSGAPYAMPRSAIRADSIALQAPEDIPRRDRDRDFVASIVSSVSASTAMTDAPAFDDRPALDGVRVVEIGHYTVAPLASRIMGAFGADVIKIEPPQGDAIRYGPPLREDGQAYIFALSNTDKRGLVLDLRDAADRDRLHRLLDQADILVENLRPGALARLGFDAATLRTRHPRLVYCPITGFGTDSVYVGRAALDSVIQAMSGILATTLVDGVPTKTGISCSDNLGGLFGMLACVTGIESRERFGIAPHFDISMQDASAWMTRFAWNVPASPASHIVQACDGYVLAANDAATEPPAGDRSIDRETYAARLRDEGIDAVPILDVQEVFAHPHTLARELLVTRPSSDGSAWTVLNSPMRLERTPPRVRTVMPPLNFENALIVEAFALDRPDGTERRGAGSAHEPSVSAD